MNSLEDFLLERDYGSKTKKYNIILFDEKEQKSKEFEIEYQPIAVAQFGEIRKKCYNVKNDTVEFDDMRFNVEIIANCCVKPNFKDVSLLTKAGCTTAPQLVSKYFKPEEVILLSKVIQDGIEVSNEAQEKQEDEIKNL